MQPLYLHVENRAWVELDAAELLYDFCEADFVAALDFHIFLLEIGIVREFFKAFQLVEIFRPRFAFKGFGNQIGKALVCGFEPAARRDAVCLVVEFFGGYLIEVAQHALFEKLRVQLRHTVYAVRAHDRQIRHSDHLRRGLLDNRKQRELVRFFAIEAFHIFKPARVDFVNYLQVPWQKLFKERNRPLFERLGQKRVVCVREHMRANFPSPVPAKPLDVHQEPHELRNGDCRVRVV